MGIIGHVVNLSHTSQSNIYTMISKRSSYMIGNGICSLVHLVAILFIMTCVCISLPAQSTHMPPSFLFFSCVHSEMKTKKIFRQIILRRMEEEHRRTIKMSMLTKVWMLITWLITHRQIIKKKIVIKFCTQDFCNRNFCYCCKNTGKCFKTWDECKDNCPVCNPKCSTQP